MSIRDYRSYMDNVEMDAQQHDRLMNALSNPGGERHRESRLPRYVAAAACLALVCLSTFGVWYGVNSVRTDRPDTVLESTLPSAPETAGPSSLGNRIDGAITPAPAAVGEEYILRPIDPFDGQVHSSPAVQGVEFDTDVKELAASIAFPDGWFEEPLTGEEMIYLLGGVEATDVPWMLYWVGYDVTGQAIYDGEGKLWQIYLWGEDRANEHNTFSLTIAPDQLPPDCFVDPDQTATELHGITVYGCQSGSYGWKTEEGEYTSYPVYKITLLNGDAGLRFTVYNMDEETAAHLATQAANVFSYENAIHLDRLLVYDGEVPEWYSGRLSLSEAKAEENYGTYISNMVSAIPASFTFESAYRELGQNRDYLSLCYTGYYTDITVGFYRIYDLPYGVMDVINDKAYYDERLYTIPYADSVPDEVMFGGFQDPVFRAEDLSLDVVEARLILRGDSGDREGYRGNFSVLYPDGMLGRYSFKGVTPAQALEMVKLKQASPSAVMEKEVRIPYVSGMSLSSDWTGELTGETAAYLVSLLEQEARWIGDNTKCLSDCAFDCSFATDMGQIQYHTDCGTFNDTVNGRSLKLTADEREELNRRLSEYDIPGRVHPVEILPCPYEDCVLMGEHDHDGVCYRGYELCPVEGCTIAGRHEHDGVTYCGYEACQQSGCTQTGLHYHGGNCYRGYTGMGTGMGNGYQGGHHGNGHHGRVHPISGAVVSSADCRVHPISGVVLSSTD